MNRTAAKMLVAGSLALGGFALVSDGAYAMPAMDDGVSAAASAGTQIEQARWVCGPYRCWWRPNYWGPRPGWRWRRWHRRWW